METTTRLRPIRPTDPDPRRLPGTGRTADAHPAPTSTATPSSGPAAQPSARSTTPPRSGFATPASSGPAAQPSARSATPPRPASAPVGSPRAASAYAGSAPAAPPRPVAAPVGVGRPVVAPLGQAVAGPGGAYGLGAPGALPPEAPVETTTRLRPVRERRTGRTLAAAACAVLGMGLIGGALAGVWLAAAEPGAPVEPLGYAEGKELWHNAPVDTLFPRTVAGPGAGPGAAKRTWTRIVVAPDAACSPAVLAKGLLATLKPLGCERVLRATYTDATATGVITVSLVFTRAEATAQRDLGRDLTARLGQDVPPALAGPGTVAARFGAGQRASWWLTAPAELPVVVTAVSGFADGRTVDRPIPADQAMGKDRTDAVAQSGLGHEAKGMAKRMEFLLRNSAIAAVEENDR
ncbi:hypothetical protein [Streptomyces wedmorensis]